MKHLRILILIPLTLLLTGSVTQQHLMVVARKNVAGGGTTELAFHAASSGSGTGTSLSFNHTLTGTQVNAFVIVGIVTNHWGGHSVTGVTYDGASMTQIGSALNIDASTNYLTVFQLAIGSKAAGTYAVVASMDSSVTTITGGAISFVGVEQSTPVGTQATATAYTDAPTVNVTSATGEIVVDFIGTRTDKTLTVGSGQTERIDTATRLGASTEPGATTTTMSWSWTGAVESGIMGVPIKPN